MQRLAIQAENEVAASSKELQLRKLQAAAGKPSERKSNNVLLSESSGARGGLKSLFLPRFLHSQTGHDCFNVFF